MFNTNISGTLKNDLPRIPFTFYPKGSENFVTNCSVFNELGVSMNEVSSNILVVVAKDTTNLKNNLIFYYFMSLEKVVVCFIGDNTRKIKTYDLNMSISTFIWTMIKEYGDYNGNYTNFANIQYPLDIDSIKKSTKFSEVYGNKLNLEFKIYTLGKHDESTSLVDFLNKDALDCLIKRIPKDVKSKALFHQKVSNAYNLKAYVSVFKYNDSQLDMSRLVFVAIPVSDELLFISVIDYARGTLSDYDTVPYTIETLVGNNSSKVVKGCVPSQETKSELENLGYKLNKSILRKII